MPVCNYESLTAANASWMQLTRFQLKVMQTVRLCHIYNFLNSGTPMPACDVSTLMADAGILTRLTTYQLEVLQTILLCSIGDALGGWLSSNVLQFGTADPNDSGAVSTDGPIYIQTIGGVPSTTWYWNPTAGEWQ